jgi:NAD(P)-dependent dehydrogenase (short-subunit alcohol dehydrogenase family)
MDVNLNAVFICSKIIGGQMVKRGWGRIINISSVAGINPFPGRGPYSTSKAGVIMFTRELAIEWAKYGVTVNAIAPGFFKTDMLLERIRRGDISEQGMLKRVPMKRLGDTADIGKLATFLASEDASYITGQVIAIDGGYTAYGFVE